MRQFTRNDLNPRVLEAEYAVRGDLPIRAEELEKQLEAGEKLPFDRVIYCNIGNPQLLGQKPITFFGQVLALVQCPWLLSDEKALPHLRALYPSDAIARAQLITAKVPALGAYSHAQGFEFVREDVAKFLEARDGHPANPQHIFLTDGASEGIRKILQCMICDERSGVLLSIPQYPLFGAAIHILGGRVVSYNLDEESHWGLSVDELRRATNEARKEGIDVRVLCLINPGNPTGNLFHLEALQDVARFCHEEGILIIADEVYQTNIYSHRPFTSIKKIVCDLGLPVQVVSVHSTSKGLIGDCGKRAGYMECYGLEDDAIAEIYKLASIGLCPNVDGQLVTDLMVAPPQPGDESYELYVKEITGIYDSLKRRIVMLTDALNELEGVQCQEPSGTLYLFPTITFPPRFLEEAAAQGCEPDTLYCRLMLEATGVCSIPGSGFWQKPGTWHLRLSCLPQEELFPKFIALIKNFHKGFMARYSQ